MRRIFGTPVIDYLPALALLVISVIYLVTAYGYRPEARAFPAAVAWVMLGLISLDLVSRTRTPVGEALLRWLNPAALEAPRIKQAQTAVSKQLAAVLWIVALAVAFILIGILYAVPLYVFAAMRLRAGRSYAFSLVVGAGVTLVIWLLFSVVLRLELFPGILFGGG